MTGFHFLQIFKPDLHLLGVKLRRGLCAFTSIHRWYSYPVTRLSGKKTLFWPTSQKHRHDAICSSYRMVYNVGNSFIVLLTILTPSVILLGIFPWVTVIIGKHILHTSYLSREPRVYPCKFFLAGVNCYRCNAKNWRFSV